jgi:riboflavin synthase
MFTGIIEALGKVDSLEREGSNLHLDITSAISNELKVDQSIAHNGVCLTVVETTANTHRVTAVEETLLKSNLSELKVGDVINLERCMKMDGRLDGHIVQGHVDTTAECVEKDFRDGSWNFTFRYSPIDEGHITVPKGSICVNGVSLTVVRSEDGLFSVTIIPFTYEHTNFHQIEVGTRINLEFDILGKYVARLMANRA